jgi:flagellar biogenesis protein FliO
MTDEALAGLLVLAFVAAFGWYLVRLLREKV